MGDIIDFTEFNKKRKQEAIGFWDGHSWSVISSNGEISEADFTEIATNGGESVEIKTYPVNEELDLNFWPE